MLVNDVLQLARDITGTTITQYPNATLLPWANIVYRRIIKYIATDIDENAYLVTQSIDAAVQNSYTLATDILHVKQVRVKTTPTATYYTPAMEIDFSKQPQTIDYFLVSQNSAFPKYQILAGSLYIAPAFTSSTAGGGGNAQILVDYDQRQADLVVGGAESTIKIPKDFHHVIAFGIKPFIEANKKQLQGKQVAQVDFESIVIDMIDQLSDFDDSKMEINRPSETLLE